MEIGTPTCPHLKGVGQGANALARPNQMSGGCHFLLGQRLSSLHEAHSGEPYKSTYVVWAQVAYVVQHVRFGLLSNATIGGNLTPTGPPYGARFISIGGLFAHPHSLSIATERKAHAPDVQAVAEGVCFVQVAVVDAEGNASRVGFHKICPGSDDPGQSLFQFLQLVRRPAAVIIPVKGPVAFKVQLTAHTQQLHIHAKDLRPDLTTIGEGAFSFCTSLTSVTIPDSVTTIGEGAFYGCSSLTSVTIGKSVSEIGKEAFKGCNIDTIVCYPKIPPKTNDSFDRFENLIIPTGCEEAYANSDWGQYLK